MAASTSGTTCLATCALHHSMGHYCCERSAPFRGCHRRCEGLGLGPSDSTRAAH
ncbi:hypothetical protein ACFFX0_05490 [Citricoccus parietis]|uniref:Uncharacterized protein n=1 Tax=Citricoccus parietis TaxID=592307 RepID=A0ABV5FVF7_9MICC